MPRCHACGTENPQGMNFCQNCGSKLAPPAQQPHAAPPAQPYGAPAPAPQGPPPAPPGPAAPPPGGHGPPPQQPGYGAPPQQAHGHQGSGPMPSPADLVHQSPNRAPTRTCPNCGAQTPDGFAFCQQCGSKLPPAPPSEPGPAAVSGETSSAADEAHAATLASPGSAEVAALQGRGTPATGTGPAWGRLVSVNRDGTDGRAHPLQGEFVTVGRVEADIVFGDDRFLARTHARIEKSGDGGRLVPLDPLNGVFVRVDDPVPIEDGSVLLLGREVLRFETLSDEEREARPLVQHGTALFGSPPREPWGRLVQLLPSGGIRDIRYLNGDEITVGREEGDLVFRDDAFLSRVHAVLRREGGRCVLDDLDSSNGTFVRVPGPKALRRGDHVRMGDQLFRFEPGG